MTYTPIYGLSLALGLDGTGTVAPATKGWGGGYAALGAPYSDAFRREKSPDGRELIRLLTGTTYACAHLCADRVASNRLRLYVRTAPGQQKTKNWSTRRPSTKYKQWSRRFKHATNFMADGMEVEEVTDHPILRLLDVQHIGPGNDDYEFDDYDADADGQPTLSGYDLLYLTQLYLESLGRAYWLIAQRDGLGNPSKIALLRSHMVREVPDLTGERVLREYEYGGLYHYDPKDVIRFAFPDPNTGGLVGGYSPMMAAIEKIRISRATDAHTSALLANMARPDAIWSPKGDTEGGGIGEAEARRVKGAMREEFTQAGRGGLLISEYPGSLQVLGWKPGDVVEIERAKAIKNDIANDFGVPNALLDLNAANLASADAAALQFAESALMPRCNRLASTLRRLLRMFDDSGRMMLMFDSPIPGDKEHDLEQSRTGVTSGISLVDEGRAAIGQDPLPDGGGQIRYVDGTLVAMLPDGTRAPDNMQPGPAPAPGGLPVAPVKPPKKTDNAKVLRELASVKRLLRKFSEDQPRVPAGSPDGGEFGSGGGRASGGKAPDGAYTINGARVRVEGDVVTEGPKKFVGMTLEEAHDHEAEHLEERGDSAVKRSDAAKAAGDHAEADRHMDHAKESYETADAMRERSAAAREGNVTPHRADKYKADLGGETVSVQNGKIVGGAPHLRGRTVSDAAATQAETLRDHAASKEKLLATGFGGPEYAERQRVFIERDRATADHLDKVAKDLRHGKLADLPEIKPGKGVGNRRRPFVLRRAQDRPVKRTATPSTASPAPCPTVRRPESY